jgi:hypothetical protein
MHLCLLNLDLMCIFVLKPSTGCNCKKVQTVGWLGCALPLTTKTRGHMSHHVTTRSYKKGPHLKHMVKGLEHAHALVVTLQTQTAPPISKHCNSNKLKPIYILRTICGHTGWATLPKALPLPQTSHMSRNDSSSNCQPTISTCHTDLPTHPYHMSYGCAMSTSIRTVQTVQSTHFFCLFDNLNRTRYLLHPMSV